MPFVDVGTARLYYREVGARDGQPCVLLHGWGGRHTHWREFVDRIGQEDDLRIIAVDLRGFGFSDKASNGYETEELAADVLELLRRLGGQDALLVGHSLGSNVALEAHRRAHGRVRGLVLVNGGVGWGAANLPADIAARVDRLVKRAPRLRLGGESLFDAVWSSLLPALPAQRRREVVADAFAAGGDALAATIERSTQLDLTDHLRQVDCPTLVVTGEHDAWGPGTRQLTGIPESRLVVVPAAGHFPMIEAPGAFASEVIPFIKRVSSWKEAGWGDEPTESLVMGENR